MHGTKTKRSDNRGVWIIKVRIIEVGLYLQKVKYGSYPWLAPEDGMEIFSCQTYILTKGKVWVVAMAGTRGWNGNFHLSNEHTYKR